ncbi:hypothetical protein [Micromonospora aurantiaca (nom. illeg.)]|uniref:hypothetical protein n=1 Tax=Micromonospora aurantiaca (nom. illeg.) TaxID=47850 RepID=UPI000827E9C7|nr:hypothetical protein [Micromonospora aurantiaca]SCL21330.1 hypothetical protein GA0070615_0045 [Micromonospora aurantiaca]SCL21467.1 hypothetical protein GA0070615_0079 [Micromonospora aurantiaca]
MSGQAKWVPRMRSRAEVEYMLAQMPWFSENWNAQHRRGAIETCRWVLGLQAASPVTGKVVDQPVDHFAVGREAYAASEAMYNSAAPGADLGVGFLQGVENLALWITGKDTLAIPDDWPFPAEAPPVPR